MTLDADYIALRARVAETHPAMLPLYDAERETVIETMRAVAAEHAPRPPAPPAPAPPAVEEDPFSTSTPESSPAALARRIAEDALTGPRPLEPEADPYGLREVSYAANRNDVERTHALTLLAKRYGVDLPTFEAAVLLLLRPEGEEASAYRGLTTLQSREPGSNRDWYRDGVLTALAGTIGEAPGAYGRDFAVAALRTLDLGGRFRSRDRLIPFEKLPDGYRRALTRIHPRSATMVQVEPGNPVWAIEAWTALGHMRRLVKRRLAEDERYRYQYPYTPEELEAAERWYAANVEPNVPSGTLMFRGVHGNAISGNEADSVHRMACRARWFLPRYGSQAGDRDLPFPDVRKADYGANFTIGDLLLDDLGWFSTYAELPGGFLVSTSREEKIEALMLAGYRFRPRSTTPSNPYDGPLSEERVYGWLRRMSDRTYGDNPWSIKIEPSRVVLVFRNYPNDPDPFQHVIQSPGKGQRAALAAIGNDAALWSAFVRYKLNQNKSSFAHIFDSILNDGRHWKNRGAAAAPAAPPVPAAPAEDPVVAAAFGTTFFYGPAEQQVFREAYLDPTRRDFVLDDFPGPRVQGGLRVVAYWWMPAAANIALRGMVPAITTTLRRGEGLTGTESLNLRRAVYAVYLARLQQVRDKLRAQTEALTIKKATPVREVNREVYRRIFAQVQHFGFDQASVNAMIWQAAGNLLDSHEVYSPTEDDGSDFPGADLVQKYGKPEITAEQRAIDQYGPVDPTPADAERAYYVTGRRERDGATTFLAGPYETHREAILAINEVKEHPRFRDDPAVMFGGVAVGTAKAPRGVRVVLPIPAPQAPAPQAPTPPAPQVPAAALPPLPPLVDVETGLTDYGRSTSKEAPRNVYAYKLAGGEQSPTAKAAMLEQGWTILDTRAGSYTHAIPPGGVKLPTQRGTLGAYSSTVTFITIRAKAPRLGAFERWADAVHAYYSANPTEKAQVVRVSPTILWTYVPARVERSTLVINNEQSSNVRYRDARLTLHTGSGEMAREWRNSENPEPPPAHLKYPRTSVRAVFYPDRIPGGQAEGMTPGAFDPERLAEGTKHELEHTTDEDIAREIAMDHLTEDPDYYRKGAGASGAGGAGAGHAPARISGARTEGSRAYQSAVYASRAAGSRDRLREATSRLFGRDLSGGAEWSTEGAWRVAPGRYLVRVDDLWYVVARQADGQGGYIDTDLTPPLTWADAVRAARDEARR